MNPHYHPYSDLSSPHSPSPDNNSYSQLTSHHNGHGGGGGGGGGPMQQMDGQQNFHQMNNNSGPIKHCAGCGRKYFPHFNYSWQGCYLNFVFFSPSLITVKIGDRFFLHALDRYWHNACLKCSCCGAMLAEIGASCYTRSGMILCKADYSR